jgi:hypothetical protein
MKNKVTVFFLLFCSITAFAQDYNWQSALDSLPAEGFYKIQLPPSITSKLKPDFSDIRIIDTGKHEVPYITRKETPAVETFLFKEYKIASLDISKKHSTLILNNPDKNKIDNIQLVIKNADVNKQLSLSGSDDKKQWYVIKDHYMISDVYSHVETSVVTIVNFPLSDYTFFKIDISDSASAPLRILKAGYYDTHTENAKYSEVAAPVVTQKDSAEVKTSYIKIVFPESQLIDKLEFEIEGPHYFMRDCELGIMEERKLKNNRIEKNFIPITTFKVSSNHSNIAYLDNYKSKELYLHISNNDNPPLKIKEVKGSQINHSIIAYLKKNEPYTLVFGNEKANAPNYDLVNFTDTISSISLISPKKIEPIILQNKIQQKAEGNFFSSKTFIWISLSIVLLILGLLSVKMIRETGEK